MDGQTETNMPRQLLRSWGHNYVVCRKDRNGHGGGVCIYVRNDLAFAARDVLLHDELEATWVELLLPKTKPIS